MVLDIGLEVKSGRIDIVFANMHLRKIGENVPVIEQGQKHVHLYLKRHINKSYALLFFRNVSEKGPSEFTITSFSISDEPIQKDQIKDPYQRHFIQEELKSRAQAFSFADISDLTHQALVIEKYHRNSSKKSILIVTPFYVELKKILNIENPEVEINSVENFLKALKKENGKNEKRYDGIIIPHIPLAHYLLAHQDLLNRVSFKIKKSLLCRVVPDEYFVTEEPRIKDDEVLLSDYFMRARLHAAGFFDVAKMSFDSENAPHMTFISRAEFNSFSFLTLPEIPGLLEHKNESWLFAERLPLHNHVEI